MNYYVVSGEREWGIMYSLSPDHRQKIFSLEETLKCSPSFAIIAGFLLWS